MLWNIGDALIVISKRISIEYHYFENHYYVVTPVLTVAESYSYVGKKFKQEAARKSHDNV